MPKIIFNEENLKEAMKIALDKGANIEIIPELMKEYYPKGTYELCLSEETNFMFYEGVMEIGHSLVSIPSFSYRDNKAIPPSVFSFAMMEDETLRKEFLTIFNKTLKDVQNG